MTTTDNELIDFYRETVLRHSRDPHNFRRMAGPDREATGHNPLCGDKLTVYVDLEDGNIADVSFEGSGCAISLASASIMTDTIAGLAEDKARAHIGTVMDQFKPDAQTSPADGQLGAIEALRGVRRYPSRVKCATLAWKTLAAALDRTSHPVSTESAEEQR